MATEVHKSWYQRFNPGLDDASKAVFAERLQAKYGHVNPRFADGGWLLGETYSVADTYLFVTTNWRNVIPLDLPGLDHLEGFINRMKERPAVQSAMKAEGLI